MMVEECEMKEEGGNEEGMNKMLRNMIMKNGED